MPRYIVTLSMPDFQRVVDAENEQAALENEQAALDKALAAYRAYRPSGSAVPLPERPGVGEYCQAREFVVHTEGYERRDCEDPAVDYGDDGTPYCAWHLS
jgi:hypothetical protein